MQDAVLFIPALIIGALIFFGLWGMIVSSLFKTNANYGFGLGLLFGPIGWILAALLPKEKPFSRVEPYRIPDTKECEKCRNKMAITDLRPGKYECRKCGTQFKID